jgi:hypothetical protein
MHEAQVLEVGGNSLQLVGKARGYMGYVVFEVALRKSDFVEHLGVGTHSVYGLTKNSILRHGPHALPQEKASAGTSKLQKVYHHGPPLCQRATT